MTTTEPTIRDQVLTEAAKIVTTDRNKAYGDPEDNFARISGTLQALGYRGPGGRDITPMDAGLVAAVIKVARLANGYKRDSAVDLAGYAACLAEAAEKAAPEPEEKGFTPAAPTVIRTTAGDIPGDAVIRRLPAGPARGLAYGFYMSTESGALYHTNSGVTLTVCPSLGWRKLVIGPRAIDVPVLVKLDPTKIPFFPRRPCGGPTSGGGSHLFLRFGGLWLCGA